MRYNWKYSMKNRIRCVVCKDSMGQKLSAWHFVCASCGYESAALESSINQIETHAVMDEGRREDALRALRALNFESLLNAVDGVRVTRGRLLDVGCAHGWFLDAAFKRGYQVQGIEPDEHIFNERQANALPARLGYFPQVLNKSEKFDFIVFNDVLEHIPNVSDALTACAEHLTPNGLLILNLPDSSGIFYRLSKLLMRCDIPGFFKRMWQVGLPSPHVHYFNESNLSRLLESHGFTVAKTGHLETLHWSGLYSRISYANRSRFQIMSMLIFAVVAAVLPLLKILPGDILYVIATRRD